MGVVLYEMVTGVVPFSGDNAVSVAYLHVREPVRAPSQRRPDLPPALEQIILTCLAKDPNERYQTSDELRADLLRFRRGNAIVGGPATAMIAAVGDETQAVAKTTVSSALVASGAAGKNKRRGPVIMVIAFLVALIAVVGFLLIQVFRDDGNSGKSVAVKNVVSLTEADARRVLEDRASRST